MRWFKRIVQGIIIVLLIAVIAGVTFGTLMPDIYGTKWFAQHFPNCVPADRQPAPEHN